MAEYVDTKKQQVVELLIKAMEKHSGEWEKGWITIGGTPENGKTGNKYHGMNAFLLALVGMDKGYTDNRWVTIEQSNELGARVKKGEKAMPIAFLRRYDKKTKADFDVKTVEGMTAEERLEYEKENIYNSVRFYSVFNAEQCDNFPVKEREGTEILTDEKRNAVIESIIGNSEAKVNYDGGNNAYYNMQTDSIQLPRIEQFKTIEDYFMRRHLTR